METIEKLKKQNKQLFEALEFLLKNFDSKKNSADAIVKANKALNDNKKLIP